MPTKKRSSWKARRKRILRIRIAGVMLLLLVFLILAFRSCSPAKEKDADSNVDLLSEVTMDDIDVQLLTVSDYARPGIAMEQVNGIVIHYTANPGSTAQNNRNYFETLKDTKTTKASSHFIVGLEGEIIQCIPTKEIAYASNVRNKDTIAIECCHMDETGEFNEATYNSVIELTVFLCKKYNLKSKDVIRHYDVTGKPCPKYFVEQEDAWEQFLQDVEKAL